MLAVAAVPTRHARTGRLLLGQINYIDSRGLGITKVPLGYGEPADLSLWSYEVIWHVYS